MHRKNAINEYSLIDTPQAAPAQETPTPPKPKPKRVSQPPVQTADRPAPVMAKSAPVKLDESVAVMLSDTIWSEPVCMRYNLTPEQFKQKVANFRLHCLSREKREHDDVTDAKRHFCNLLSQGKLDNISTPTTDTPTDYTYSGGFGGQDV